MKSGIYKITNPNGKVYIGESINVYHRINQYKKLYKRIKYQYKIYNSLIKYGVNNHTFEIIEFCDISDLKIKERYWQDYYDVLNNGLNLKLTSTKDKKQVHSQEVIDKISKIKKEQYLSGIITSNWKYINRPKYHSEETKIKISLANTGENNDMNG